ncbi:MAG: HD domain-containing protein [Clostridia bacterium]|nr:HD domain-containing protein [Clostridia bacterium]
MTIAVYEATAAVSMLLTIVYMFIWHKHCDVHITLTFVFVPLVNVAYVLLYRSKTLEAALNAVKIMYLGGCFLILILTLIVFSLCHIYLNRWVRVSMLIASTLAYCAVLTIGHSPLFYSEVSFEVVNGIGVLHKTYGPAHTAVFAMISCYYAMSIGAMGYACFRKKQVSNRLIYLLFLPVGLALVTYYAGRFFSMDTELLPFAYTIAQVLYLIIIARINLYDITDTAIDSLVESGDEGIISFDQNYRYLGSNGTAKAVFPQLRSLKVDHDISRSLFAKETMLKWLLDYQQDASQNYALYEKDGKTYRVQISDLYNHKRKRGYQFIVKDDTKNQQYIHLLNTFNSQLQTEVAQKTAHIVEMHDNLIMSLATMVESRDNSTGGHIRRTSEGVRLLIDEMTKDPNTGISDSFRKNIIKAAPMHDLGKIAVDDVILRKPGRFTPEEFEKMKSHAAEGARIVHEVLKATDDLEFHLLAENVAHYHHERWDGSGYPEGLKGEKIPLEARIMAIADVYDALVSKRVYKDSMSFSQADQIITEGMGKHFDPMLKPYYDAARPKLEAYYSALEQP